MTEKALSKKDLTRQLLTESAIALFLEVGFTKAVMRDIATRAGMKAGSMFYHFKSKDELLFVIMENSIKALLRTQEENYPTKAALKKRLRSLIQTEVEAFLYRTPGSSLQVMIHEWRHLSKTQADELMFLRNTYEIKWLETLRECKDKNLITANPQIVRRLLNGALAWLDYWYKEEGEMTVDEIVDEILKMLIRRN